MPVNELIPKELGWQYSDDMSLLPLRRKITPYAAGQGPVSLAVPGFARTMLNDLWLAASGPARAAAGEFSPEEMMSVAARAGGAMTWGGGLAGVARPSNVLGMGGSWFGKPAKDSMGMPISSKTAEEIIANPKLANVSGELKMLNEDAFSEFSKKGYILNFKNGEYLVYPNKKMPGDFMSVPPDELPFDLQSLHSKLTLKQQEFSSLKAQEMLSKQPKSPITDFNKVYDDASKELGKLELAIGIDPKSGDFKVVDYMTGESHEPLPGGITDGILGKLKAAKEKYTADVMDAPSPPVSKLKKPSASLNFGAPGNSIGQDAAALGKYGTQVIPAKPGITHLGEYGAKIYPTAGKTMGLAKLGLEPHPVTAMREYTPKELDWEYGTEYEKYAKSILPDAFKDRVDFQAKYDAAPLRHLSDKELKDLDYATLGSLLKGNPAVEEKLAKVHEMIGTRRDVPAILKSIQEGTVAPPIVIRHDDGMRLLGGNTRLMSAIALGKNLPVKVIDIRSLPHKGSDVFDASAPLTPEQRAENFNNFFSGSKITDDVGNPMIMYHASPANSIEAFDPAIIKKKSGESRDFTSVTSDPNFANHWKSDSDGTTHYPVFVSAKNPGDFRDPDHVTKAAEWVTREELKNWKHLNDKQLDDWLKGGKYKAAEGMKSGNMHTYEQMLAEKRSAANLGIWTFWENPKMWKALGWDGAFMLEENMKISPNNPVNFAAPDPGQIKSVFNKGYWNPKDHRLLYAGGAGLPLNVEPIDHDPFAMEEVSGDPFAPPSEGKKK